MKDINRQFLHFCNMMQLKSLSSNKKNDELKWEDLFDWLINHKKYDAKSFWSSLDEYGNHFYTTILNENPDVAFNIYDFWLKEIKYNEDEFFNHKNKNGHCLLNVAWSKYIALYNLTGSRTGVHYSLYKFKDSLLPDLFEKISKKTNDDGFTWLDKNNNIKASGIVNELISFLSKSIHQNQIQKLLNSITERFPQDKASSSSRWNKVKKPEQIIAMLNTGYSLEDDVKLKNQSMPAWKWITLQFHNKEDSMHLIDNNISKDKWGYFKDLQKNINHWMNESGLVAKEYREKIGYVRRVLNTKETDPWGRNSIDYLLLSRQDLLPVLINELNRRSVTKKDFKNDFLKPDMLGYTICNRAIVGLDSTNLNMFLDFFKTNDIPIELGFEKKGLLKDYIENQSWHMTVSSLSGSRNVNRAYFNKHSISLLSSIDEKLIFGDDDTQKEWVSFWNKFFSLLKDEFSKEKPDKQNISTFMKKYASLQLYAFSTQSTNKNWGRGLNKTLLSQLCFASYIYAADPSLMSSRGFFPYYNNPGFGFPEIYTKEMQDLLYVIPSVSNPLDLGRSLMSRKASCIKNEMMAHLSKTLLKGEIVPISDVKRRSKRKVM